MPNPPQYFGYNAGINKYNPFDYQQVYSSVMLRLRPE